MIWCSTLKFRARKITVIYPGMYILPYCCLARRSTLPRRSRILTHGVNDYHTLVACNYRLLPIHGCRLFPRFDPLTQLRHRITRLARSSLLYVEDDCKSANVATIGWHMMASRIVFGPMSVPCWQVARARPTLMSSQCGISVRENLEGISRTG